MAGIDTRVTCPLCGLADQSQSAAAIVAAQTAHTHGAVSSFGMGFTGRQVVPIAMSHNAFHSTQSPLAQMLDLPAPPPPRQAGASIVVLMLSAIWVLFWTVLVYSSTTMPFVQATGALAIPAAMGVAPAILSILAIRSRTYETRRWSENFAHWQAAVAVWQTLMYCARDHVVYQPKKARMRPEMVRRFCYDQATGPRHEVQSPPARHPSQTS